VVNLHTAKPKNVEVEAGVLQLLSKEAHTTIIRQP
jgi:hypothetical protein